MEENNISPIGALAVLTNEEIQQRALLNSRFVQTSTNREVIEDLADQVSISNINLREANVVADKVVSTVAKNHRQSSNKESHYYTKEMGVVGMEYMIDNRTPPNDTLEYVRQKYSKTLEWLTSIRKKTLRNQSKVVEELEERRGKEIQEFKDKGTYLKSSLTRASTPVQQLKHLYQIIKVSDRLDMLEENQMKQAEQIQDLQERLLLAEQGITNIEDHLFMPLTDKKKLAYLLKLEGCTYEEISDKFSVSVRTVKYWVKEVKLEEVQRSAISAP